MNDRSVWVSEMTARDELVTIKVQMINFNMFDFIINAKATCKICTLKA